MYADKRAHRGAVDDDKIATELEVDFQLPTVLYVLHDINVLIGHMFWYLCLHPHYTGEVIRTILLPSTTVGTLLQPPTLHASTGQTAQIVQVIKRFRAHVHTYTQDVNE